MKTLILSDGIPGHFNQSRGVASLLQEDIDLNEEVVQLEPKIRSLRSPIKLIARYLCNNLTKFKAKIIISFFKSIDSSDVKLIIAAGGNTAAFSAALSLLTDIPNIQLGSPRGIHSKNFNTHLTIEKYFDVPNNVVLDITPNLYSPESCKNASNEKAFLNSALFLIGGQGIGYSYEEAEWNQLIQNIIDFTKLTNSKATIVTSRRTDPSIEELLKSSLSNYFTDDSIWFHDGGANANLAELFGNATKIFVTEDSAMMISESISSGKKVTTLFPKSVNTPARYSNHIQKYRDLNLIDSQSIKDQLSFEEGKDNIEKINLIREGLKKHYLYKDSTMKGLVWLRNDIRMDDNPSLKRAFEECNSVICVYVWSPEQLKKHNEANIKQDFLIQNLKSLAANLHPVNVALLIIESKSFNTVKDDISNLIHEHSINKIYWNKEFAFDEITRDKEVYDALQAKEVDVEIFNDQIIYEPGFLRTGQDNPFSVFTPFKRRWIEHFDIKFLDIDFDYPIKEKLNFDSNVEDFDFGFTSNHGVDMQLWPIGEASALDRVNDFLDNKAIDYSKNRNDPILNGTSRISPYLALGVISSKRCILEGLKKNNFELSSGNIGITKWIDEIVWREFYRNITYSFPKVSKGQPFQDYTKNIEWIFNEDHLNAWKQGNTGFPLIDAAMRQLIHEGWMHNRLRMVVAMFFTKNMLHDWRLGEAYFMQNLIDGDFASNNGGWQWSSSTGTDAAPYFRIFNPITQSKNFDKEGLFIKKYVPELQDLDKSVIHDPPNEHRKYCNYPLQILDLKESRVRAIEVFNKAKNT